MANQLNVKFQYAASGNEFREPGVGLLRPDAPRNQPEPAADAMDMRVDRQHRLAASEQKDAGRGLGADAIKPPQITDRFGHGPLRQEIERQRSAFGVNRLQDSLDARGLPSRKPSDPDRPGNARCPGPADRVPIREAPTEFLPRGVAVRVRGILGKDRGDQFVEHRCLRGRLDRAIMPAQTTANRFDFPHQASAVRVLTRHLRSVG